MLNEPPDGPSYMTTLTQQMEAWIRETEINLFCKTTEFNRLRSTYWLYSAIDGLSSTCISYMTMFSQQIQTWINDSEKYLRSKATELNQIKWIYGLYGALDGLSTSFSLLKFLFDAYYSNSSTSSSDALHDWVLTPEGLFCEIVISGLLVTLSSIANLNAENKSAIPQFMGMDYLMLRDIIKAYKNTYKGLLNALNFANMYFPGHGYNALNILPQALVLGTIAAINRVWLRRIRDERKGWKKQNEKFVQELEGMLRCISPKDDERVLAIQEKCQLQSQSQFFWQSLSKWQNAFALVAAAFSGVIDSPYLYFGVLGVAILATGSWFFLVVAACSIIFAAVCVATRVYEEQNYQRELLVTQLQVELAINKRLLALQLQTLKDMTNDKSNPLAIQLELQQALYSQIEKQWEQTKECKKRLAEQSVLPWGAIILGGLKNGVDAYGAVASMMFATATFAILLGWTFPPVLLVSFVAVGMACLLFFLATALLQYQSHLTEKAKLSSVTITRANNEEQTLLAFFKEIKACIKQKQCVNVEQQLVDDYIKTILGGMSVDPSPQFFFQEWFEVIRLWCSGGNKGIRAVSSVFIGCQKLGEDGHYHDTHSMVIFAYIDAAIFALVFALRGFARLGRDNKSKANKDAVAETVQEVNVDSDTPSNLSSDSSDASNSSHSSDSVDFLDSAGPSVVSFVNEVSPTQEGGSPLFSLSIFPPIVRTISAPAKLGSQMMAMAEAATLSF